MGVAEASSADPEYESRIQAALADVANGTHKRQTLRDRSKGLHVPRGDFFLSHNSSCSQVKRKLLRIGWFISLVQHVLCTLVIYVHESPILLESIPDKIGIAVSLLATRNFFLPASHGILTRNVLKKFNKTIFQASKGP
jgi:hypothetical protein